MRLSRTACSCPACQPIIDFEVLAEVQLGDWCPHCLLPSAASVLYSPTVNGWPLGVSVARVCLDCGTDLSPR
jgi:hypothetical protein